MKKRLILIALSSLVLISCEGGMSFPESFPTDSSSGVVSGTGNSDTGNSSISDSSVDSSSESVSAEDSENTDEEISGSFEIPDGDFDGYYANKVDFTLTGAALKTDLFQLIKNHRDVGYGGLYEVYEESDIRSDGTVWDMYSNMTFRYNSNDKCGNYSKEGDCFNREHTIPQSVFNEKSPMKSDAFHIYPTDGKVNGMRSNYPHAEVSSATYVSSNGSKVGSSSTPGYSGKAFEPIDEYKGDFARTYFYFVTCYQDKMASMEPYACFAKNTYPSLSTWATNLYLKWSQEDPVSQKEIERNEAVYKFQNNRNPFIDFPGLEQRIWSVK